MYMNAMCFVYCILYMFLQETTYTTYVAYSGGALSNASKFAAALQNATSRCLDGWDG